MIKFFRHIRQRLLSDGKISKYLLYAIGEIALVMIGILLALQVNNWNNNRINKALESKIVKQIHNEFIQNKENFNHGASIRLKNLENCQKIMKMFPIDLKKVNLDSLSRYLKTIGFRGTFNPANGGINTLSSSASFDIISNEKLRSLLIEWKVVVDDYLEDEAIADYHLVNYWDPYMNKHFLQRSNDIPRIEDIYDDRTDLSFLTTIEFENLVIRRMHNLQRSVNPREAINEYQRVNQYIDEIIELTKTKD